MLRLMRLVADGTLRLAPSDLANDLACAHLTQLELAVLRVQNREPDDRPVWSVPDVVTLRGSRRSRQLCPDLQRTVNRIL